MTTLNDLMVQHGTDKSDELHGYAKHYERLFGSWRHAQITLLEVGVQFLCSIRAWLDYFPNARIIGVDCHPVPDRYALTHPRFDFRLGSMNNPAFIGGVALSFAPLDIVIDDGSHYANDSKICFDSVWPHVKSGGYYVIEDVETWFDGANFGPTLVGAGFMLGLFGALNHNGKDYRGKPNPPPYQLGELEKTIASIELQRGLVIIRKV